MPVSYTPPSIYAEWWRAMEECSGRRAPMRRVRWYVVPDAVEFEWRGKTIAGLAFDDHRIVLAELLTWDQRLVKHEMLHDLLGVGGHPRYYFELLCGEVIDPY